MTVGNLNYGDTSIRWKDLPQVNAYCTLHLKEKKFLLTDLNWLYDWYQADDVPESKNVHSLMRKHFRLDDFIHKCLENHDTEFIHEHLAPELATNTLTVAQEELITELAMALFTNLHANLEESLNFDESLIPTPDNRNSYNLVGFFGTTAIIALGENVDYSRYPTFEEAYGDFNTAKWRDKICDNPVFQTVVPVIHRDCIPPMRF